MRTIGTGLRASSRGGRRATAATRGTSWTSARSSWVGRRRFPEPDHGEGSGAQQVLADVQRLDLARLILDRGSLALS
jgi:hypothetical protein